MERIRVWPHLIIIATIFALLGGVVAALWVKHQQTASAKALPPAARVERVEGEVGLNNSLATGTTDDWIEVTQNMPVSVGDRIYTRDQSRASIAFTGRNFARLNPDTSLDVLSLSDRRTQIALRDGSALFDVGYLDSGDLFEVATPYGAVDFNQPGLYEVGINDNGGAWISVLSGLAQVVGLAGSGEISKGEMLTLLGQAAADVALSRINPTYAGGLVNEYYGYRYPDLYDGRYSDYNAYLDDPYYYDPYQRYSSYQYANDAIPGLYDLDYYGDWRSMNGYGQVWCPRVDSGWAPYQSGYWVNDYPYGLTWVSNEPWGYAPYHYGRWAYSGNQWFWVPERVNADPLYSPALVAFLPMTQDNGIGWVPLAPGDPYAPRYYNENWQPYYFTRTEVIQPQVINLNVPGAVTVVSWQDLDEGIDRRIIRQGDRRLFADVRPVLDPLLDGPLRNAALRSAWGRGKIDLPPGIARRLETTTVVTNAEVVAPQFRRDLTRRLRVEGVSEKAKRAQFKVRDERHVQTDLRNSGNRQVERLVVEAARGNKDARHQMRQLEQQQRHEQQGRQRVEKAQGERVGLRVQEKALREATRQQQSLQQEEQRIQTQRQVDVQRQARERATAERAAQESARRALRTQERQSRPKAQPRIEYQGPPAQVQNNPRPAPRRDARPRFGAPAQRQAAPQLAAPRPEPRRDVRPRFERPQRQAAPQPAAPRPELRRDVKPRFEAPAQRQEAPASIRQHQSRQQQKAERKEAAAPAPQSQAAPAQPERGKKGKGRP